MEIHEGRMPYLGYETYYRVAGRSAGGKTPLVLLHGGPGSTHNYFEVLDALAEADSRQLVMYDQLGCGGSWAEAEGLWTMETWLNELEALREHLGLEEVHLLGQSWGGMLLLEYICTRHPAGVKSIVYQAAEAEYMLRHAAGPVPPDGPECLLRPRRQGRTSYVEAWGPNEFTPAGALRDFDVTELLRDIRQPALIISGGNDLCTPYVAKYMYDQIPNARWELFRDCRHMCFVEDTPRYIDLLQEWLNIHD